MGIRPGDYVPEAIPVAVDKGNVGEGEAVPDARIYEDLTGDAPIYEDLTQAAPVFEDLTQAAPVFEDLAPAAPIYANLTQDGHASVYSQVMSHMSSTMLRQMMEQVY